MWIGLPPTREQKEKEMKLIEKAYFTGGILLNPIEDWKLELVKLIKKANDENKYLKSHYQQITFTPKGLVGCLIMGKFVWGVVNFELINPIPNPDYSDSVYEEAIKD